MTKIFHGNYFVARENTLRQLGYYDRTERECFFHCRHWHSHCDSSDFDSIFLFSFRTFLSIRFSISILFYSRIIRFHNLFVISIDIHLNIIRFHRRENRNLPKRRNRSCAWMRFIWVCLLINARRSIGRSVADERIMRELWEKYSVHLLCNRWARTAGDNNLPENEREAEERRKSISTIDTWSLWAHPYFRTISLVPAKLTKSRTWSVESFHVFCER